ncbi:aminotransferase class IV [Clostridium sp.]|uniref:aminotransferase class IV n=1 Tax=Clostridium sp. TaxID=1506 RepID=UPI001A4FF2E5|nr:aminotransferase class IV [Clostridium sp.]MBK5240367.1 aminotransferase class IV family protein [Clostridium sp.]
MEKCTNSYFLFGEEIKNSGEFDSYYKSEGKTLYEVIRVSDGIPVFLMEHLDRLENSANIMRYSLHITRDEIIDGIIKLIDKNSAQNENLKLIINYDPRDEKSGNNTFSERFLAYFIPHDYPSLEQYEEGVKTITYQVERENPNAKVINNKFREKVDQKIKSGKVYEAILVDNHGFITEGSKSNIFMIKGSTVVTSKGLKVLPGITRQFIIKVCKNLNIDFREDDIHESHLKGLTGLFISGTSPKVLPIKSVDEFSFNSSKNSIINSIMVGFDVELNQDKQKFVKFLYNRTINK